MRLAGAPSRPLLYCIRPSGLSRVVVEVFAFACRACARRFPRFTLTITVNESERPACLHYLTLNYTIPLVICTEGSKVDKNTAKYILSVEAQEYDLEAALAFHARSKQS